MRMVGADQAESTARPSSNAAMTAGRGRAVLRRTGRITEGVAAAPARPASPSKATSAPSTTTTDLLGIELVRERRQPGVRAGCAAGDAEGGGDSASAPG